MVLDRIMPMGIKATVGLAKTPVAPPMDMKAMMTKTILLRFLAPPLAERERKATSTAPLFCIIWTADPVKRTMANSTEALWKPVTTAFSTAKGPCGDWATAW